MSALQNIKAIILRGLKNSPEQVKKSALKVFTEIDNDLDQLDYNPSTSVEDAVAELDAALLELTSPIDESPSEPIETVGSLPRDMEDVKTSLHKEVGNLPKNLT